ncbi:hypothetical protein ACR780_01960 [Sphingobacterium faecium]|jgi:uncharacterized membrane protein YfhO|uniref:hypothetical protein n=1 Tax=Sphingobacterium faecium TaxID=34087 RepID=UPI003DA50F5F
MKCRYIIDKIGGKVLIPGCDAVANSYDMSMFTCRTEQSFSAFEKQRYNEVIKEKDSLISELEKENASLNRIIKKLLKK